MNGRRPAVVVMAVFAALGAALAGSTVAHAHALRIASSPAADELLQAAPAVVSVTFGEEPDPHVSTIAVLDSRGTDQAVGAASASPADPRTLSVAVGHLPAGVYTVSWRTLSAVDGHRAAGSFAFGVGVDQGRLAAASAGGTSVTDTSPPPGVLAVAGRWLLYAGLLAVLGAALLEVTILRTVERVVTVQCLAGAVLAIAGTMLVVVTQATEAGLGAADLMRSAIGRTVVERLAAAVATTALVLGATRAAGALRRALLIAAAAGAGLGMLADVSSSHAAAAPSWVTANVVLQWVHITAVGFWLGGLAALILTLRRSPRDDRGPVVRRFSTGAGVALLLVLVTGTVRAAVEIGSWGSVLTTTFGKLVLVKVALIAVLAALGAVNRWRGVPRAVRSTRLLRRVGSIELGAAAAAVLVAAVLVNVAPPASAQGPGPAPPPAPVTLAGNDYATTVKVGLTVSPGAAGFNIFSARVRGYDSGQDVAAAGVQLSFALTQRPDIGASTLALARMPDGSWTARGGNLSLDGVWSVTVLVENGAQSADVAFTLPTRTTQRVDVSAVSGQPTIYTVHLDGGRQVQWYLDPQVPGRDEVHATFFDAAGNGYAASTGTLSSLPDGGAQTVLPTRQLEPGHYVGDATLAAGRYRFDIVATGTDGMPLGSHIDITVGS